MRVRAGRAHLRGGSGGVPRMRFRCGPLLDRTRQGDLISPQLYSPLYLLIVGREGRVEPLVCLSLSLSRLSLSLPNPGLREFPGCAPDADRCSTEPSQ